jgi:hypothetical protein
MGFLGLGTGCEVITWQAERDFHQLWRLITPRQQPLVKLDPS